MSATVLSASVAKTLDTALESVASPVRIESATKRFKQGPTTIEAIRQVSLSIADGEFVAIMGASGSGKSTLLHVTAGLTWPDAGNVFVAGSDLSKMCDAALTRFRRRKIGLIFQSFNLIPSLTAEQNILLPLMAEGAAAGQREQLDALLERLGMTSRRRHRPDALSGGEQQRVAIARALITSPAVVLADEPTGSLDSVTGQKICQLLQELCHEQRRTIAVVTHEPAVARWASRVVVMKDGQILTEFSTAEFGNPHALAAHYQDIVNAPGAES
ncbi:MAG: transporter, ATP-binding protein [Planctomycetaceae bacterium]|nr:transporter, ATP-binding protein [Planctomycetaceae bacterium]